MEGNLPAWLPLPPRSVCLRRSGGATESLPSFQSLDEQQVSSSGKPWGPPQPTPAVLLTLLLCLICLPRLSVFYMDQNQPYEIVFSVGQQ